jgi:hypothetical protein
VAIDHEAAMIAHERVPGLQQAAIYTQTNCMRSARAHGSAFTRCLVPERPLNEGLLSKQIHLAKRPGDIFFSHSCHSIEYCGISNLTTAHAFIEHFGEPNR